MLTRNWWTNHYGWWFQITSDQQIKYTIFIKHSYSFYIILSIVTYFLQYVYGSPWSPLSIIKCILLIEKSPPIIRSPSFENSMNPVCPISLHVWYFDSATVSRVNMIIVIQPIAIHTSLHWSNSDLGADLYSFFYDKRNNQRPWGHSQFSNDYSFHMSLHRPDLPLPR